VGGGMGLIGNGEKKKKKKKRTTIVGGVLPRVLK